MNYLALDLEMNQPSRTIIQVGYVIGNIHTGKILLEIREPLHVTENLDQRIIQLTGVTQENVDDGTEIKEVYMNMCRHHKNFDCFRNPIVWGDGDSAALKCAMHEHLHLTDETYVFGRRSIDVKTLFVSYCIANGLKIQSGLAKSLTRMGLKFRGRKHDALDDARNTFIMYRKILEKLKEKA